MALTGGGAINPAIKSTTTSGGTPSRFALANNNKTIINPTEGLAGGGGVNYANQFQPGPADSRFGAVAGNTPAPPMSAPKSTGAAAAQAVTPKQDPVQQQMMNAMLNKMMKEQEAGAKAKRADGSIDTNKLDQKVVDELKKLHEGMKDYAKQMNEKIGEIDKASKDDKTDVSTKEGYKNLLPLMKDFTESVEKNSDPSKNNKEFNPGAIVKKYDALEKAVKEAGLENDPKVKGFMDIAKKARDQAEIMDKIATGNNATLLKARDQLVTDSKGKLDKVDSSGDPKLKKLDESKKAVLEAAQGLKLEGNDPKSKDYAAATEKFQSSLKDYKKNVDAIQKDDSVKPEIKQAAKDSLKPLELLQETQTLIPETAVKEIGADGKAEYDQDKIDKVFRPYVQKHSDYVEELSTENGKLDEGKYRDYYNKKLEIDEKDLGSEQIPTTPQNPAPEPETPDRKLGQLDNIFDSETENLLAELDDTTKAIDDDTVDSIIEDDIDLDLEDIG